MSMHVGDGANYKDVTALYVGVASVWKPVIAGYVGVGGVWKPFFTSGLASPTNLSVVGLSPTSLRISWTAVAGATRYKVERATGGGSWSEVLDTASTTWDNTGLADGTTYSYRVSAYNNVATSGVSGSVSATTVLKAPVIVSATLNSGDPSDRVNLSFNDGGSVAETEIKVYISKISSNAGFNEYPEYAATANSTSKILSNLHDKFFATGASGQIWIKLRNYNSTLAAYSEYSNFGTVTLAGPPTAVSITSIVANCSTVVIYWTAAQNAKGYRIYYKQTGEINYQQLGVTEPDGVTGAERGGLVAGITYNFQVRAFNAAGEALAGNTYNSQLLGGPNLTSVSATQAEYSNTVTVTWNGSPTTVTVSVSKAEGAYQQLYSGNNTVGNILTYQVNNYPSEPMVTPGAPSLSVNGDRQATISWSNSGLVGDAIIVLLNGLERARLSTGETTYTFTNLTPSSQYSVKLVCFRKNNYWDHRFRVQGSKCNVTQTAYFPLPNATTLFFPDEYSGQSGQLTFTTLPPQPPAAPSGLTAIDIGLISSPRVLLMWSDNSSNESGFEIERDGVFIASVSAGTTSYADSGVVNYVPYVYRVRAYNSAGASAYSNEAFIYPIGE